MRRVRNKRPEQALQQQIADFLHLVLPREVFWTAFPAGGGGLIRGAILQGMGLRKGCPDLLTIHQGIARWLEVKAKLGRISAAQKSCHQDLIKAGCEVAIVRSIEDVCECLDVWGIPHKTATVT